MAYDEELADRLREQVAARSAFTEMKMFGGVAFLVGGHLAVGASSQGGVIVRSDPDQYDELLADSDADAFEMRGRPMRGWLHVAAEHAEADDQLERWVEVGVGHARSLPPKG